ncbi:MAG: CPBP family intramembrane metalloprotease, partial [Lactococcus lactis]|nr:CPBP family intramembrane metalloprotease [Lactococcus lactis]
MRLKRWCDWLCKVNEPLKILAQKNTLVLTYWLLTKRSISDLFFLSNSSSFFQTEDILAIGLGIGLSIVMLILIVYFSKRARRKVAAVLADESIQFLIPKTLGERLLFLFVAITAGFCEEIIFRGVMLYYLSNLSHDFSIITIGIISSILFGIIHLYQGWKGVLQTTYLG